MKKHSIISIILLVLTTTILSGQVIELKDWCLSKCDLAGDEMKNTKRVFMALRNDSLRSAVSRSQSARFPLRIGIVREDTLGVDNIDEFSIKKAVSDLNEAFRLAGVVFYIDRVDLILSDLTIEELSSNSYLPYNSFSRQYDVADMISIYIFDHGHEFCTFSGVSMTCGRRGGFSYILSNLTNNIVLSTFDLKDQKIVAHEFGHFFGLYHTFEEVQFGKDNFDPIDCEVLGDCLCDTPPDPGSIFEVYVNYSSCEMMGLKHENGSEYQPMIQNYMSYYKPCYLKEYQFTSGQYDVLRYASRLPMRQRFSR